MYIKDLIVKVWRLVLIKGNLLYNLPFLDPWKIILYSKATLKQLFVEDLQGNYFFKIDSF